MPDPNEPTFDPGLDVAILVFSHVEHVKTRLNLARVSKLWLEASQASRVRMEAGSTSTVPDMDPRSLLVYRLLDDGEALAHHRESRGLLGAIHDPNRMSLAASGGVVRLLTWREEQPSGVQTCRAQPRWTMPTLQYLRRTGALGRQRRALSPPNEHWDCLQYRATTSSRVGNTPRYATPQINLSLRNVATVTHLQCY